MLNHLKILYTSLFLFSIIFSGCNQNDRGSGKVISGTYQSAPTGYVTPADKLKETREAREQNYKKEIELARLKSQEHLEIAKIEVDGKRQLKQIESNTTKTKIFADKEMHLQTQLTKKEIAVAKEMRAVQTQEKDIFLYQVAMFVAGVLILIALLVYYLIHKRNRLVEAKLHEERLKHEAAMQKSAQQHEKIGRMLEIIADEGANEKVKQALVGILNDQKVASDHLISIEPKEDDESKKSD